MPKERKGKKIVVVYPKSRFGYYGGTTRWGVFREDLAKQNLVFVDQVKQRTKGDKIYFTLLVTKRKRAFKKLGDMS